MVARTIGRLAGSGNFGVACRIRPTRPTVPEPTRCPIMRRSHGSLSPARLRSIPRFLASLAAGLGLALGAAPAHAALPSLVPRSVIYGNPSFAGPEVSPDGRWLSYHARSKGGVMNVHVRPLAGGADRTLTDDRAGDVFGAQWAPDSRHLLFYKANGGD